MLNGLADFRLRSLADITVRARHVGSSSENDQVDSRNALSFDSYLTLHAKISIPSLLTTTVTRIECLRRSGDGAQIGGHDRVLVGKQVEVADLDVGRHDARPFSACAKEPLSMRGQARGVKSIAGKPLRRFGPTTTRSVLPSACSINTSNGSPR